MRKSRSISVRIDEIVLHGFPQLDRFRVADAVQEVLQELLAEPVTPSSFRTSGEYPELAGGPMRIPGDASASTVGRQIARSVYEAMRAGAAGGPDESRRRR